MRARSCRTVLLLSIAAATALAATDAATSVQASAVEREILDMSPDGKVGWSMRSLLAPIGSIFVGGPGYYYKPRKVEIETTPPGALVDLFYIRRNFQKRFEQAETPVTVILPPRIDAGSRDILKVRAFAEGYEQKSTSIKVTGSEELVQIDLDPLPNTLVAMGHRYFAGRASLSFLTEEALTFRLQEANNGLTVILTETGMGPGVEQVLEGVRSPLIGGGYAQQLGQDLLVQLTLSDVARRVELEPRARERYDAARELHEFSVDLVPRGGGAEAVAAAQSALASVTTRDVSGCGLVFDESLREQLDAGSLSRALAPQGSFTDRYLRAAMRRLGEVSPGGVVEFVDGSQYRPEVPIELEMALTQAAGAKGYLALLRELVSGMEASAYTTETLRSLVAPELDGEGFALIVGEAERRQRDCLASR